MPTSSELFAEATIGSIYFSPEEMPDPSETVLKFQDGLRSCMHEKPPAVIDFPILADLAARSEKTLTRSCGELISYRVDRSVANRLYTSSSDIAQELVTLPDLLISRTSIAETSAHKVFFAVLTDGDTKLRIAVKPFEQEPEKAITEWANTLLARSRGFQAFAPIGFLIHEGVGYAITKRQDDIEPMDNAEWSAALFDPETHGAMLNDLLKVGPALARAQAKDCFHGDPQLKNIVINQDGTVHFIDWESAIFLKDSKAIWSATDGTVDHVTNNTAKDLKVLFGSLARSVKDKGVGFLDNLTPQAQWSYFRELIVTPYLEEHLELAEQSRSANIDSVMARLGLVEQEIYSYIINGEIYESLARMRQRVA
jgi:hypothetical protein